MPVKYTVQLDYKAARNPAAFSPAPAQDGIAAFRGPTSRSITGHPGDMGISSPKPAAIPPGPLNREAQPSYNSPDTIFPSQYYNRIAGQSIAGVKYFSTNELPVPATAYNSIPQIAYRPARIGGVKAIGWPPSTPVWQTLNGTPAGS